MSKSYKKQNHKLSNSNKTLPKRWKSLNLQVKKSSSTKTNSTPRNKFSTSSKRKSTIFESTNSPLLPRSNSSMKTSSKSLKTTMSRSRMKWVSRLKGFRRWLTRFRKRIRMDRSSLMSSWMRSSRAMRMRSINWIRKWRDFRSRLTPRIHQ